MPFPQPQTGVLTVAGNFRTIATGNFPVTAAAGDVLVCTPTTAAQVLNLPAASLGGVVTVINLQTVTGTIQVKTTDSSTVNGVAGATGINVAVAGASGAATVSRFVSDGTNWWSC